MVTCLPPCPQHRLLPCPAHQLGIHYPPSIKPLISLSLTLSSFFRLETGQVQGLQACGVQPNKTAHNDIPLHNHQKLKLKEISHQVKKIVFNHVFYFFGCPGLPCFAGAFSSLVEQGLLFIEVLRLLIAVFSLVAEHRLQACGLQQLQHIDSVAAHGPTKSTWTSVVVGHGLIGSSAYGISPDQG